MNFEDILYEVKNGVAWITINRPEKMNAFRGQTCDEIIRALNKAGYDREVGAIVLTGAGEKAFCTGGDQSAHPPHHGRWRAVRAGSGLAQHPLGARGVPERPAVRPGSHGHRGNPREARHWRRAEEGRGAVAARAL